MVHSNIIRITFAKLANSSLDSGSQIVGIVVFYIGRQQVRVKSGSIWLPFEAVVVKFAELLAGFRCVRYAEQTVYPVFVLNFLNALVVF